LSEGGTGRESYGKKSERLVKRAARSLFVKLAARKRKGLGFPPSPGSIRRIIVIRQHNQFGDVLCTVPLLRALRDKFNLDELAVVVSPQNITALDGCKYVTTLINYDKLSFYRHPSEFLRFFRKLRNGYDVLLVPSNVSLSLTNDIMSFFVKAKYKIGPGSLEEVSNRTASVYDVKVPRVEGQPTHQYSRNMKVAQPLGISGEGDSSGLEYNVDEVTAVCLRDFVTKAAGPGALKVAIHAGAGKTPNRWDTENFAVLSRLLHERLAASVFLTEGPMDHDVIDRLAAALTVPFIRVKNKAISFVGAMLKQMDLIITNDTGIMHLAAAVGTPTLSLFGPTDPLQWAPPGPRNRFILGKRGDINTIPVEKVFEVARKVIQTN